MAAGLRRRKFGELVCRELSLGRIRRCNMRLWRLHSLPAAILLIANVAWGSPPSASTSTVPAVMWMVGADGVAPDQVGAFLVEVRGLANNPIPSAVVVVDVSGAPDVALCSDQEDASEIVNCTAHTVVKVADSQGQVRFTLLGGSLGAGKGSSFNGAAKVFANGVLLRTPRVATFDLDGTGGVGANDLAVWLSDFGAGQPLDRSDFDGDGSLSANDLALWLSVFGDGHSVTSCGASCP